ncbi:hypothetical protein PK35_15480 [Tamlana nanhaiensis]|uniref:Uncharacterized protein n=1 Tax=Neotamlana nanhaiensis TaxID=1382798 RepID=A0A0D7VWM6_9FLAO|nr:hypothetical protein [Tamlana nanhaiensis]KJD31236.1 hypothetical protein PK35_15480 [Tamlana nanhaiensis]
MDYNTAFEIYYNDFLREFGERKIRSIQKTINNSKHTRSLLNQCYLRKICPNPIDLRQSMLSNIKLSLSSKAVGIFAMALLLKKFNDEVNINDCIVLDSEVLDVFTRLNSTYNY